MLYPVTFFLLTFLNILSMYKMIEYRVNGFTTQNTRRY